jgi:hypothetical protein
MARHEGIALTREQTAPVRMRVPLFAIDGAS